MYKEFPVTKFLKNLKERNYKDSSRYLSWKESRIFINDLLENILGLIFVSNTRFVNCKTRR